MRMTESKFIDSSVWLAYFFDGEHKNIIENEEILLISIVSLFEIKRKLLVKNVPREIVKEKIDFIKKKSHLIDVDLNIAEKAVEISLKNKLAAIDSLIYASSLFQGAILLTRDNDFRGLPEVQVF